MFLQAPVWLQKTLLYRNDDYLSSHGLRLTVSHEARVPGRATPARDALRVRVKRRHTFNYKNEFLYELTEVWSGPDVDSAKENSPEYEVRCSWKQ
jgi:hypothetical protein